jgi:hypothetical protein
MGIGCHWYDVSSVVGYHAWRKISASFAKMNIVRILLSSLLRAFAPRRHDVGQTVKPCAAASLFSSPDETWSLKNPTDQTGRRYHARPPL